MPGKHALQKALGEGRATALPDRMMKDGHAALDSRADRIADAPEGKPQPVGFAACIQHDGDALHARHRQPAHHHRQNRPQHQARVPAFGKAAHTGGGKPGIGRAQAEEEMQFGALRIARKRPCLLLADDGLRRAEPRFEVRQAVEAPIAFAFEGEACRQIMARAQKCRGARCKCGRRIDAGAAGRAARPERLADLGSGGGKARRCRWRKRCRKRALGGGDCAGGGWRRICREGKAMGCSKAPGIAERPCRQSFGVGRQFRWWRRHQMRHDPDGQMLPKGRKQLHAQVGIRVCGAVEIVEDWRFAPQFSRQRVDRAPQIAQPPAGEEARG